MERKRSVRRGYPSRRPQKPLGEKIKDFLRHFVAFMFSNVGIIGLVVGYSIVGALIFQKIEGGNKSRQTHREEDAAVLLNLTANELWNVTCCGVVPLEETAWRAEVTQIVRKYQEGLVSAYKSGGSDSTKATDNWSFSGAFLYSLTVITTIGYGNVTPRTDWGKITTVLYAIIGMPLFLLYLSNIGDILAKSFKWTYAKLWLCKGCPGARRRRLARALQHQQQHPPKYNVKATTPAPLLVQDFGDDHSWTPGANAASLPGRRRLGVAVGVHAPYDGYLEAAAIHGLPIPRGHPRSRSRGRSRGRQEYEDEDAGGWDHPHRARRVGVDYGRDGEPDEDDEDDEDDEYDDEEWDGTSGRSRSRSAFRAGPGRQNADAEPAFGVRSARAAAGGRSPGQPTPRRGHRRGRRGRQDDSSEESDEDVEEEEQEVEDEDVDEEESPSTEDDLDEEEELEEEEYIHDDDMDEGEVADDDTDGESSAASSDYDPQTVTVPVTLCLAIMVSYVCGGAVLFSKWEQWDMLDGSYFCFISLSTIGFGDIVPGGYVYSNKVEVSFIFCSMYLMLGMALIAMCFNLMQEEVIHKMRSCIRTMRYVTRCNRRQAGAAS